MRNIGQSMKCMTIAAVLGLMLRGRQPDGSQAAKGIHPGRAVEHAGACERIDVRFHGR